MDRWQTDEIYAAWNEWIETIYVDPAEKEDSVTVNSLSHFDCHSCDGSGVIEICDSSTDALLRYISCGCAGFLVWKHMERWSKFPSPLSTQPF